MSTITLYDIVNITSLTVEDRQLIETLQTGKGRIVDKIIVEFLARQWKLHMTGSSIQLTNNLNCSQERQPCH